MTVSSCDSYKLHRQVASTACAANASQGTSFPLICRPSSCGGAKLKVAKKISTQTNIALPVQQTPPKEPVFL